MSRTMKALLVVAGALVCLAQFGNSPALAQKGKLRGPQGVGGAPAAAAQPQQIGRASCRERV